MSEVGWFKVWGGREGLRGWRGEGWRGEALGGHDALRATCGLPISTYFTGAKLRWLQDHVPAAEAALENGTALVGTVDSWLMWNLTGAAKGVGTTTRYVTDVTNASRTMMVDLLVDRGLDPPRPTRLTGQRECGVSKLAASQDLQRRHTRR